VFYNKGKRQKRSLFLSFFLSLFWKTKQKPLSTNKMKKKTRSQETKHSISKKKEKTASGTREIKRGTRGGEK
jgi:hypothetical protein